VREEELSTGQLATFVYRSPATLRRYEAKGFIPPARRDPISHRRFWTQADAELIRRRLLPVVVDPPPNARAVSPDLDAVEAPPQAEQGDADASE